MAPIREIIMDDDDVEHELRVTFYPELYLQRRIWILSILRRDNITQALDVGCGEGELLGALSQPAPWLAPPPEAILPPDIPQTPVSSPLTIFNSQSEDDIPNLHTTLVHGLDVSSEELAFAIKTTQPPEVEVDEDPESPHPYRRYSTSLTRFEDLDVKLWKGGLEVINEEFVNLECIVSTEVIEHLSPSSFPFFAPVLLGVYHPKLLLITTPSYTFNSRFLAPDAPLSVRKGYPDPTKRTERVFRHSDHKFEWTTEEFEDWCNQTAKEWGYLVHWTSIGRALDPDPYGRDEELGGASFVAEFRKLEDDIMSDSARNELGRKTVERLLAADNNGEITRTPHELVIHHHHGAHPSSQKPRSLPEIAKVVKNKMEEYRESFMRLDELWFERQVATACGGWIEFLVKAVEESVDLLLKKEEDGVKRKRDLWTVEIIGSTIQPENPWTDTKHNRSGEADIPPGWTPGEGNLDITDYSDVGDSTGIEGDISLCGSEEETANSVWSPDLVSGKSWARKPKRRSTWQAGSSLKHSAEHEDSDEAWSGWGGGKDSGWGESSEEERKYKRPGTSSGAAAAILKKERMDGNSSTAGWDGDADDSDTE